MWWPNRVLLLTQLIGFAWTHFQARFPMLHHVASNLGIGSSERVLVRPSTFNARVILLRWRRGSVLSSDTMVVINCVLLFVILAFPFNVLHENEEVYCLRLARATEHRGPLLHFLRLAGFDYCCLF